MTLAELVVVRDAVIAAQARADRTALLLEGQRVERDGRLRIEIGCLDDELARASALLEDAIHRERNGSGS